MEHRGKVVLRYIHQRQAQYCRLSFERTEMLLQQQRGKQPEQPAYFRILIFWKKVSEQSFVGYLPLTKIPQYNFSQVPFQRPVLRVYLRRLPTLSVVSLRIIQTTTPLPPPATSLLTFAHYYDRHV